MPVEAGYRSLVSDARGWQRGAVRGDPSSQGSRGRLRCLTPAAGVPGASPAPPFSSWTQRPPSRPQPSLTHTQEGRGSFPRTAALRGDPAGPTLPVTRVCKRHYLWQVTKVGLPAHSCLPFFNDTCPSPSLDSVQGSPQTWRTRFCDMNSRGSLVNHSRGVEVFFMQEVHKGQFSNRKSKIILADERGRQGFLLFSYVIYCIYRITSKLLPTRKIERKQYLKTEF